MGGVTAATSKIAQKAPKHVTPTPASVLLLHLLLELAASYVTCRSSRACRLTKANHELAASQKSTNSIHPKIFRNYRKLGPQPSPKSEIIFLLGCHPFFSASRLRLSRYYPYFHCLMRHVCLKTFSWPFGTS